MRIFISGGAGFIGSNLALRLAGKNDVTVFDNAQPGKMEIDFFNKAAELNVNVIKGDIRNESEIIEALDGQYDAVVHLAANSIARDVSNMHDFFNTNVTGTFNILEAGRRSGIEKFIFASSSSVYGDAQGQSHERDDTDTHTSPYGATKKMGEIFCNLYKNTYGLETSILRFFTVYGPRGRLNMAIMNFIRKIDGGMPIEVYGNGTIRKDFVYIDDVIDAIELSLQKKVSSPLNIGTGVPHDLNTIVAEIEKNVGKKARISYAPIQKGDVKITHANIESARKLLGWKPKTDMSAGIKKTIEWWNASGKSLY